MSQQLKDLQLLEDRLWVTSGYVQAFGINNVTKEVRVVLTQLISSYLMVNRHPDLFLKWVKGKKFNLHVEAFTRSFVENYRELFLP